MTDHRSPGRAPSRRLASRIAVICILLAAVAAVLVVKRGGDAGTASVPADPTLPRLVDLGADKCIPCKKMAPILEELRREYAGRFEVVFIDVWKNRAEVEKYGIRVIPTQVFFDGEGRELFRHEGFFSRADILRTWREHGIDVGPAGAAAGAS